jgi:hypothetical protein
VGPGIRAEGCVRPGEDRRASREAGGHAQVIARGDGKPSATSVTIHPPWLVNPEADANDRSHADSDPMEEAYRLAWEMEQANCKAGEEPRLSKFIFADHRNISWDQLQEPYKIAWRSFVDREIFKRHVRDEAPSAR